ncbi:RodZ domain-containing protein [Propionivibrio sp.]|uniref:helix-turn-helix domain-containing protein n=1 Tax=Propionivibrio sp. TaxID=2212460 RepID=UPI002609B5FA|nr:RodZ domain-containing protein [Propionivibrio sp.]
MSGTIAPSPVSGDDAYAGSVLERTLDASVKPLTPTLLSVGQQLGAARQAKGLTTDDVAKALKLSLRQVEALEADDWPSLPCNTIIRGFVRNYARLLSLNPDLLMGALDRLKMPQEPELEMSVGTSVPIPQESKVDRRDFARVLSGLIVLLLAVSAYFFLPEELWLSTVSALKSATQPTQSTEVAKNVVPGEPEEAKAPDTVVASPATAVLPDPSTIEPQALAAPFSSATVLKFSFAQPSWVEVRDHSGQIIFSQNNQAGTQRELEGQPPFALVIGNSAYVTLQYKGKTIDLSKRSKDDVARLTLE